MEKSPANHFLILFRDSSCQFRGVYSMNPVSQELVRLAGVGPRTVSSAQVESIYKYSSDRKQFSTIPSKTMGMSVDAFTIPSHLWQGGAGAAAGPSRRASITKKAVVSKWCGSVTNACTATVARAVVNYDIAVAAEEGFRRATMARSLVSSFTFDLFWTRILLQMEKIKNVLEDSESLSTILHNLWFHKDAHFAECLQNGSLITESSITFEMYSFLSLNQKIINMYFCSF